VVPETYDIFSGSPVEQPLWLESVSGLEAALQRMIERARQVPGPYFVFCVHTKEVLQSIDTSRPANSPAPSDASDARGMAQKA